MNKKIKVTICTGTHCFVMGGSELLLLDEYLPDSLKDRVEIEGSNCLEICEDRSKGKAPFVMINNILMDQATIPKVLKYIEDMARD